jgi:hypothetical protein
VDASSTDTYVASSTPDFTTYNHLTFSTSTGADKVFATIADVNAFSTLQPGDSVLFRKGQTWREQLTVPSSGSAGNPITFDAYGSGALPTLDETDVVTSWTTDAGVSSANLESTDAPSWTPTNSTIVANSAAGPNGGTNAAVLTDNSTNAEHVVENYPSQTPGTTYTFSAFVKAGTLSWVRLHLGWSGGNECNYFFNLALGAIGGNYVNGNACTAVMVPAGNGYYRVSVSQLDPAGSTYVSTRIAAESADGTYGYVGTGKTLNVVWAQWEAASAMGNYVPGGTFTDYYKAMGTTPNQVFENGTRYLPVANKSHLNVGNSFWDSGAGRIYVRTSGDNAPSGYTITASQRDYGVSISSKNYITVQNLHVTGANRNNIEIFETCTGITINANTTDRAYQEGIRSETYSTNLRNIGEISNNTVSLSGGTGIDLSEYVTNYTVELNTIFQNAQLYSATNGDLQFTAGIRLIGNLAGTHVNGMIIQKNSVYSNGPSNTALWATNPLNAISLSLGTGIWIDTVDSAGAIIRYNLVHDNAVNGIHSENNSNLDFYGNVIYNSGYFGFVAWTSVDTFSTSHINFFNNTVYNTNALTGLANIGILGKLDGASGGASTNMVKNNIAYGGAPSLMAQQGGENDGTKGSGNVYLYNNFGPETTNFIAWGSYSGNKSTYAALDSAYGSSTHSVTGDPKFTNAAGNNFTLTSSSPAIDAGVNLGSTYQLALASSSTWPSDVVTLNQNSYGAGWDIGAYVYTQTSTPSVVMTAPVNNATVSSTVTVSASSTAVSLASVASVQFYLDGSPLGSPVTTTSSPNTYSYSWNTASSTNASHTLYALAIDNYANTATSTSITVTVNNAPPVISSFSASSSIVASAGTSTLSWSAPGTITNIAITPGTFSTSTASGTTTVNPTSTTLYTLTATNANGTSTATTSVQVATAPTAPGSFTVGSPTTSTLSLAWASSTPNNGATISFYAVYRGTSSTTITTFIATTTSQSYVNSGLATSTTYWYDVVAQDSVGNVSASSTNASATTLSGITPAITSFTASSSVVATNGTSTLSWTVSGATSLSISPTIGTVTGTSTTTPALATTTVYTLTATNANGTSTATTELTVDNTPPSVSITSPANGATVSGSNVTIVASSTDTQSGIASVTFYLDGSTLDPPITSTTSPDIYSYSWNTASSTDGSYTLYALATDNYGNTATSTSISVTVANVPILSVTTSTSLSFTAAHGSTATSSQPVVITNSGVVGTTLNWSASSTQTWLTFSPSSGPLAGGASTSVAFIVDPATLALGTYHATATIADPQASSSPQTIPVTLTVSDTGVSTSITSPADGATVFSTVTVAATATSTAGIASVQFSLDGSPLGSAVTSSPYSVSWNTALGSDGSHTLTASTTDLNANVATSSPVTVTVANTPPSPGLVVQVGGGGGTLIPPTNPAPPLAPAATTPATSSIAAQLAQLQAKLQMLLAQLAALQNASTHAVFARNLGLWDTGTDVTELQQFLIAQNVGHAAQALAQHGATTVFGMLTYRALMEFQASVGITPAAGYFGPKTRAYIAAH